MAKKAYHMVMWYASGVVPHQIFDSRVQYAKKKLDPSGSKVL